MSESYTCEGCTYYSCKELQKFLYTLDGIDVTAPFFCHTCWYECTPIDRTMTMLPSEAPPRCSNYEKAYVVSGVGVDD